MFFNFLFAVCLHLTYACPTSVPCLCLDYKWMLEVRCKNAQAGQVFDALTNITDNITLMDLGLEVIELVNLPQHFLLGLHLQILSIQYCNLSSLHENAFLTVSESLKQLELSHNALERVPSRALEKLHSLTQLNMDHNRLEALHSGSFGGLFSLLELSLRFNRIKYIDISAFVLLGSKFRELELAGNELTAIPFKPLRNLVSLKYLGLYGNKISTLQPEEFDAMGCRSLTVLHLENNAIRHLPPRSFQWLEQLQSLVLIGNVIESIHPLAFQGLDDNLQYLYLGNNRLNEIPAASLKNMSALKSIKLEGNNICSVRKDDFLPYGKNLTSVYLHNNSLTSLDSLSFSPLDSLEILFLDSNRLNTVSYETFAPILDTLEAIYINDNPFNCDCKLSWLSNWMKGRGSRIIYSANDVKCAWPKELVGIPLTDVPVNRLVCRNSTPKPHQSCDFRSTAVSNSYHLYINVYMVMIQVSFTYFAVRTSGPF